MIKLKREGVILRPTPNKFECKSVFNPATIRSGKYVHMIYRAIDDTFLSCLGYAKFKGPLEIIERWKKPFLYPKYKYEKKGIEDPRIVKLGGIYYIVYIAHDGKNALLAYLYGEDLFKLKRGGIISPRLSYRKVAKLLKQTSAKDEYFMFEAFYRNYGGKDIMVWDKDGYFFPNKINGNYALVHRILPDIQIAYAKSLKDFQSREYWREYFKNLSEYILLEPEYGFEIRHIGGGAPPIKTGAGWLFIYHGTDEHNDGRNYQGGAALLDLDDPQRVIARLPYPLISPEEEYELTGHVNNVVFPSGTTVFGNRLYIYYGAADSHIAAASIDLDDLLKLMLKHKN